MSFASSTTWGRAASAPSDRATAQCSRPATCPFGGYRAGSGPNPITSHAYTSQRENMDIGLYYYNARYYAPYLNRFISADSIIPDPTNPQNLNRYAYSLNNPVKYRDPSGHCAENGDEACWSLAEQLNRQYGLGLEYLGRLSYAQLSNTDLARVLAFTLSQLVQTKENDLSEADAMMNILTYAIEDVAGGDETKGLEYAASVFYREIPLIDDIPGVVSGYDYQDVAPDDYLFDTSSGFAPQYLDSQLNQVEHFINESLVADWVLSKPFQRKRDAYFVMWLWEAKNGVPLDTNGQADYALGRVAVEFIYDLRKADTPEERDLVTDLTSTRIQGE